MKSRWDGMVTRKVEENRIVKCCVWEWTGVRRMGRSCRWVDRVREILGYTSMSEASRGDPVYNCAWRGFLRGCVSGLSLETF